jgi:hypothetical protein
MPFRGATSGRFGGERGVAPDTADMKTPPAEPGA